MSVIPHQSKVEDEPSTQNQQSGSVPDPGGRQLLSPDLREVDRLTKLPNELLDIICSDQQLKCSDLKALLTTCEILHCIASSVLYRVVNIQDAEAHRFLRTVVTSKTRTLPYGPLIRSLSFTVVSNFDIYVTFDIFCTALSEMHNLIKLSLSIPAGYTVFLIKHMKQKNIIHDSTDLSYRPSLPNLHELCLQSQRHFLDLINHRTIHTLELVNPIPFDQFSHVINKLESVNKNGSILRGFGVSLHLASERQASKELVAAIRTIALMLPHLQELALYAPHVNALLVSQIFKHPTCIFPLLKVFSLNRSKWMAPKFVSPRQLCLDIQRNDIQQAAVMRSQLVRMTFGSIRWTNTRSTFKWKYVDNARCCRISYDLGELWQFHEGRGDLHDLYFEAGVNAISSLSPDTGSVQPVKYH